MIRKTSKKTKKITTKKIIPKKTVRKRKISPLIKKSDIKKLIKRREKIAVKKALEKAEKIAAKKLLMAEEMAAKKLLATEEKAKKAEEKILIAEEKAKKDLEKAEELALKKYFQKQKKIENIEENIQKRVKIFLDKLPKEFPEKHWTAEGKSKFRQRYELLITKNITNSLTENEVLILAGYDTGPRALFELSKDSRFDQETSSDRLHYFIYGE